MLIDLIATLAAGFVGGGVALMLRAVTGGRLPKGLVPTMAGLAMLGYVLWSEYTWFPRTVGALPDSVVVFSSPSQSAAWRPWTLVVPVTQRFAAADKASIRTNDNVPGQLMVDVLIFNRNAPGARLPVLIDCAGRRRAEIVDGVEFGEDGAVVDADWTPLEPDDPLAGAVCPGS